MTKHMTDKKRRSVSDILEGHSPNRVLKRYHSKIKTRKRETLQNARSQTTLKLPAIQLIRMEDHGKQKDTINIKDALVKIFSAE